MGNQIYLVYEIKKKTGTQIILGYSPSEEAAKDHVKIDPVFRNYVEVNELPSLLSQEELREESPNAGD